MEAVVRMSPNDRTDPDDASESAPNTLAVGALGVDHILKHGAESGWCEQLIPVAEFDGEAAE